MILTIVISLLCYSNDILAAPISSPSAVFQCKILKDATWSCNCSHANEIFSLHQSKDFFIVCNNNHEMSLMKSAGMFFGPSLGINDENEESVSENDYRDSGPPAETEKYQREEEHEEAMELLKSQKKEAEETARQKIEELTKRLEQLEKPKVSHEENSSVPSKFSKLLKNVSQDKNMDDWQESLLKMLSENMKKEDMDDKPPERTNATSTTTTKEITSTAPEPTTTMTTTSKLMTALANSSLTTTTKALKFDGCDWNGESLKVGESRKDGFCRFTCIGKMNMYRVC